ncbi:MAG: MoxR family ATPase [Oligoflexia bacterium]|nr:MoxR family ATPase [Oligoflexia bacterium]
MSKKSFDTVLKKLKEQNFLVGREEEIKNIFHCILCNKNILLQGPVGVGKTFLLSSIAKEMGRDFIRIDGDSRYTEHKLTGWFDPPKILKSGYTEDSFFSGPLLTAMKEGRILFINELNRMPENVQNILLPALDERRVEIPKIGSVLAKKGFCVVATQNPKEFIATSHLSEAILDRFELVTIEYQSEEEEKKIVEKERSLNTEKVHEDLLDWSVKIVRQTRTSSKFRRGASVRAAISIYDIAHSLGPNYENFLLATSIALPNRVELNEDYDEKDFKKIIEELTANFKKKRQI